jgi:hypothetical protein
MIEHQSAHPFRDDLDEDYIPDVWTSEHVGRRFVEACETLIAMPMPRGPSGRSSAWPEYQTEFGDEVARVEVQGISTDRPLDRFRRPSSADIAQMDKAFAWPPAFLWGQHDRESAALSLWANCRARDMPFDAACYRRRKRPDMVRRERDAGLWIIATGLIARGDPVF